MGCLLEWKVDPIMLVPGTKQDGHHMERAICYHTGCTHAGIFLAPSEGFFHCDNQAVVDIGLNSRAPHTMGLVYLLYFCASRYNIYIVCVIHVTGVCNSIADSLSCSLT